LNSSYKEKGINICNSFKNKNCREEVRVKFPHLEDFIFNPSRRAGLRLLDIKSTDKVVFYGCDWGNILVYVAKYCHSILVLEENTLKLNFIKKRIEEEKLKNIILLNSKIGSSDKLEHVFDFAIINGTAQICESHLRAGYLNFLKQVLICLKKGGRLFFAVDNKMYYQFFISTIRPFQNDKHLYSRIGYIKLLYRAGFKNIKTYAVFPNYEFPQKILPLWKNVNFNYLPVYKRRSKRTILNKVMGRLQTYLDLIVFKKLKYFNLSPSFIFIARSPP